MLTWWQIAIIIAAFLIVFTATFLGTFTLLEHIYQKHQTRKRKAR